MSSPDTSRAEEAPPLSVWRYVGRLAPLVLLWVVMAGLLGWLLYTRAAWNEQSDRADIREWIDNTRIFRKTLAELVKEYVDLMSEKNPGAEHGNRVQAKRDEIDAHIRAMTEPTRVYASQLPLFPEVYKLEVAFREVHSPDGIEAAPVRWESPKPRPGGSARAQVRTLSFEPPLGRTDSHATIRVEYRLHTYNRMQHEQDEYRFWQTVAALVLVPSTLFALFLVIRFLRRERARELDRWRGAAAAEHQKRELLQAQVEREVVERNLLESRVKQQEAEHAREELGRKLLEQELDAAKLVSRAAEAENAALELKTELYASIGIMAGSYAHNIKPLCPNDFLALHRTTALHPSNRQPQEVVHARRSLSAGRSCERFGRSRQYRSPVDPRTGDSHVTWGTMGRESGNSPRADVAHESLWVNGDLSHLQQAVENLLFNARDATFEMRNYLRDEAKREPDPAMRRTKLLEAAAWRGKIAIRVERDGERVLLEVRDNGIGMTEEVRRNCLKTHFTTKRDNALYEGYSAGMGLGLSFVAMVLEHHGAELEIESAPLHGTTFRMRLPLAESK